MQQTAAKRAYETLAQRLKAPFLRLSKKDSASGVLDFGSSSHTTAADGCLINGKPLMLILVFSCIYDNGMKPARKKEGSRPAAQVRRIGQRSKSIHASQTDIFEL